ncbi:MAG: ABC transporter ATP-binding protein [Cyclobacteriaceae bacterium]
MKPILELQSISKKFSIHHEGVSYLSLRDRLAELSGFNFSKKTDEVFWALRDISFNVMPGESIGIIGKNGAGKSTLLKILSKITPPTHGKIISRGRIASLLEVGTGFHPELTGRENIYLNGSILGMKRKEIGARFDEIVDFAGTEKFLDTPLKHYSSGMQLRLAFAVAAFLEPEILIIDEVLAVGDAEFQKKCLGKMEDVSRSGRTILFVSHNMSAVESLCKSTLLLENGKVKNFGPSSEVMTKYLSTGSGGGNRSAEYKFEGQNKKSHISEINFLCDGKYSEIFYMGCQFEIRVHFKSEIELEFPLLGIIIYDSYNTPLLCFSNKNYQGNLVSVPVKEGVLSLTFPSLSLMSGRYSIDIYFSNLFSDLDVKRNVFEFTIEPRHFSETGEMLNEKLNRFFIKDLEWKAEVLK